LSSPSPPPGSRFLAIRFAGQDATDFHISDETVGRFIELRDAGDDAASIATALGLDQPVVLELVHADEAQALARRIAAGDEPMYPIPAPEHQVIDTRAGSSAVPIAIVIALLVAVVVYAVAR
jgi:hypothetical protein